MCYGRYVCLVCMYTNQFDHLICFCLCKIHTYRNTCMSMTLRCRQQEYTIQNTCKCISLLSACAVYGLSLFIFFSDDDRGDWIPFCKEFLLRKLKEVLTIIIIMDVEMKYPNSEDWRLKTVHLLISFQMSRELALVQPCMWSLINILFICQLEGILIWVDLDCFLNSSILEFFFTFRTLCRFYALFYRIWKTLAIFHINLTITAAATV